MAASSIVSIGQRVDALGENVLPSYIHSGLIRLGFEIGDLDGRIGPKTRDALSRLNIDLSSSIEAISNIIDEKLQSKFPQEFFVQGLVDATALPPPHIIT